MHNGEAARWDEGVTAVDSNVSHRRRWAELGLLFGGGPALLFLIRRDLQGWIIPIILVVALCCLAALLLDKSFPKRQLWNARDFRSHLWRTLRVFLPLALVASTFSFFYEPDRFMAFPRRSPAFWLVVMVLYPLLSAYPQELIYRAFFFHRYRMLFRSDTWLVVVSAVAFGWAHMFLGNWIAPLFTMAGGLLFARTYRRSGSLLQTTLEHGLWGDFLFTVGIGWYFYAGSIS